MVEIVACDVDVMGSIPEPPAFVQHLCTTEITGTGLNALTPAIAQESNLTGSKQA